MNTPSDRAYHWEQYQYPGYHTVAVKNNPTSHMLSKKSGNYSRNDKPVPYYNKKGEQDQLKVGTSVSNRHAHPSPRDTPISTRDVRLTPHYEDTNRKVISVVHI